MKAQIFKYIVGFVLSLTMSILAYAAVTSRVYQAGFVLAIIALLAFLQSIVQLHFFMHLGEELKPKWRLATLLFAVIIIAIVVGGSLWIMASLDYTMGHSDHQVEKYLERQSGF